LQPANSAISGRVNARPLCQGLMRLFIKISFRSPSVFQALDNPYY
jgi:hypothetical protein